MRKIFNKDFLFIFCLLSIFICLWFINGCNVKKKKKIEKENVTPVKITKVKRKNIKNILSLTADIHGEKEVKVYAKVSGKLIKKVKKEGDYVKETDVIALIDRDEPAMDFSYAEVKSPIDGVLSMYFADLGEAVFPAQPMPREPVAMVISMKNVKVIGYLGEKEITKVKKGQDVTVYVDSYPNKVFKGRVTDISPVADPLSRKFKVEARVPNRLYLLKPGTFARLDIIIKSYRDVLVVPKKAVLEKETEGEVVFTVEKGKAKMIRVLTGACDEQNIEIKEGLKEGQEVIIEGNYGLIEGTEVEIAL